MLFGVDLELLLLDVGGHLRDVFGGFLSVVLNYGLGHVLLFRPVLINLSSLFVHVRNEQGGSELG